jgi:endonuclease/exonuclease/phosphatase (EEP) superfamily protein YafD
VLQTPIARTPVLSSGWRTTGIVTSLAACLTVLPVTFARLMGGEQRFPAPLLAAAAPFAVPALAVAVPLALVGGRRWIAAVPGALLALHLAWLAPSLTPHDRPAATSTRESHELTVMTANVYLGQANADALVREVRERHVDVLAVEELTPDAVQRLRDAGLEQVLPSSVLAAASGASGTGLWSRLRATALPPVPGTLFAMARARVDLPGGLAVTVTAAHPLSPTDNASILQWRRDLTALRRTLEGTAGQQVMAGDFNATRDHAPFRDLLDGGLVDAADAQGWTAWPGMTWPAHRAYPPVMRLDHVLVSAGFAVQDVSVVELPGTDHRPVVARLTTTT